MSSGFSWLVIGLTALNIIGAIALLWWTRRGHGESEAIGESTTGHTWDGDLKEYNNPLPRWWLWLFILSVIFGIGYLVLYPGMGNFRGTLGWSQISAYEADRAELEATLKQTLQKFAGRPLDELVTDPGAQTVGRNLFAQNCSTCHGSDARGALGFPNLVDADWQWGGSPEQVLASIRDGHIGVMPAWGEALGDQAVEDLVAYVLSLSGRSLPAGNVEAGRAQYALACFACHGEDARGVQAVGGPNLTDNIWVYGGSVDAVRESIALGHQNQMPAHGEMLGETRVALLAAYVLGLGAEERRRSPADTSADTDDAPEEDEES